MRTSVKRTCLWTMALAGFGTGLSVSAQVVLPAQPPAAQVRRLTADEAVRLAAENNLGIQIARFDPQIEDLGIAQTRAAYTPTFNMSAQQNSNTSPPNSFLSGAQNSLITDQFSTTMDIQKNLSWGGGNYAIGWDGARSTSNNFFTNFNPQLRSSLSMSF